VPWRRPSTRSCFAPSPVSDGFRHLLVLNRWRSSRRRLRWDVKRSVSATEQTAEDDGGDRELDVARAKGPAISSHLSHLVQHDPYLAAQFVRRRRPLPGTEFFQSVRSRLPSILHDSPDLLFQIQRDGSLVIWGVQVR